MYGKGTVIWLDDGIGHLGGWHDGEAHHHTVGVFLTDLGDQESTHTSTRSSTEGVGHLETLEAIARFGFLAGDIQDRVDEFSTFGVVTLSPVVTGTSLAEDKVVGAEDLAERSGADRVHRSWFQIYQDSAGDILATGGFVEVDVDALQLEIGVTVVGSSWVNSVFVGDDFPELGTDLVTCAQSQQNQVRKKELQKKLFGKIFRNSGYIPH